MGADRQGLVRAGVYVADASLLVRPEDEAEFLAQLTVADRAGIDVIRSDKRRREFLVSRVLVRAALAHWSGVAVEAWRIVADERGRPFARASVDNIIAPSLSWSHSGDQVICAVSETGEVGVDVELIRPRDVQRLARAVFDARERATLANQPQAKQADTFYQLWTLKEAFSKALGTGLSTPLRELVFDYDATAERLRFLSPGRIAPHVEAQFVSFVPAPQTVAALALLLPSAGCQLALSFHTMTSPQAFVATEVRILSRSDD